MEGCNLFKNIAVFAAGLVLTLSLGCGGTTRPTNTDAPTTGTAEVKKMDELGKKDASGAELTEEESEAGVMAAGNKGGARRPTPAGTPKQ